MLLYIIKYIIFQIGEVHCPRNKIYFTPSHRANLKTWIESDAFCKASNYLPAKITTEEEQRMAHRFR